MRYLLMLAVLASCAAFLPAQGTVLAVFVNNTNLVEVDPTDGSSISTIPLSVSSGTIVGCTGMAQDPTTGIIYVSVRNTATQTDINLGTLNKDTGLITIIGAMGGHAVATLAFDTAGTLYAVTGESASTTPDPETLYSVNKATAAMTLLHALGNGDNGEAIGFDPNNTAVLYHWSGLVTPVFESVNISTGATTPIAVSGLPASQTILCMAWDSNASWFWTCTAGQEFGYIRTNGSYVGFGPMAGQAKGMVVLPTIAPDTPNLNVGTTTQGLNSTPVSFTLRGYNLFGNVTLNAPADIEISLSQASGYSSTLNVPPSSVSGQLNATTIYARIPGTTGVGPISATMTLTTLGGDDFDINVTGQVDPQPNPPEINVLSGATPIASGGNDPQGDQPPGIVHTITYTIENNGDMNLMLTGTPVVAVTPGTNIISATVATMPGTTIGGLSSVQFDLDYEVGGSGAFDISISIENNDSDENPYTWTVTGTVQVQPPEIDIDRGGTPVADGATDTLPTQQIGNVPVSYTIHNTGGSGLTVGTVTVSAEVNCTVAISAQPASNVGVGGTTTLELVVTPTAVGAYSFSIEIPNNDPDEDPYDINVAGNVTAPPGNNNGGGDDDGDDDEGCVADAGTGAVWLALLAALSAGALARRVRRSTG